MSQKISANEIVSGLWLGNEEASQSQDFLKKANIKVIINATKHISNSFPLEIEYYQIPVNDPGPSTYLNEDNAIILSYLTPTCKIINYHLKKKNNILVHCHAGAQRSATIVLIYLIKHLYTSGSKKDRLKYSINHLLKNRPIVFHSGFNASFQPAISQYLLFNL